MDHKVVTPLNRKEEDRAMGNEYFTKDLSHEPSKELREKAVEKLKKEKSEEEEKDE